MRFPKIRVLNPAGINAFSVVFFSLLNNIHVIENQYHQTTRFYVIFFNFHNVYRCFLC